VESPPTLKLRRINVAADPWSAKKRKVDRGQRTEKMSFLPRMSFLRNLSSRKRGAAKLVLAKAGSRNPEVGSVAGELLFAKKMIWRQENKMTR